MDPSNDGEYVVTTTIADGSDGAKIHTTKRTFLNPGGGTLYEEDTTVTFTPGDRNSFKIAIAFPQGTVRGKGYTFSDQCHYGIDVSPTHYIECTLTATEGKLSGIGSSNNKGVLTSWRETLQKQS
jgi:hypothetical protein